MDPAALRTTLAALAPHDRDAFVDRLLGMDEIPADDPALPRGCVPYLPCPVTEILEALELAGITEDDVFVDVGSGLGRVTGLVHLLTGATCVGLEIQPQLVRGARARAERLGLSGVRFVEGDAVDQIGALTDATVFFLYCPFGRERLQRVLDHMERDSVRICTVGLPALDRPWLEPVPSTSADLAVYRSTYGAK